MIKESVNTFIGGMNRDIDKSVLPNNKYLDAQNYRLITTEGSTTGSLENIKGNIPISVATLVDGYIIGSCELRDDIILFVTNNITSTPATEALASRIYRLRVNLSTEIQTSLELLYDDTVGSNLNFSTYYPIKAIGKYETPNVQKIYWTDGYNNIRYANVADYLTSDGLIKTGANSYMSVDKFDFLPAFTPVKPVLSSMVGGKINTGVVAYSYQLYQINGAETAFSPLSDPIHVVADSDFKSNTKDYRGDGVAINSGKGFIISINNTANLGFNRLRLVRVQYSYINSTPEIFITNEIEISPAGGTVLVTDTGEVLSELTIDQFNISSTELFKCQDIASKDGILFAANIDKSEFIVDDFDTRAVRFRNWVDPAGVPVSGTTVSTSYLMGGDPDITISDVDANTVEVSVANFSTSYSTLGTAQTVTDVHIAGDVSGAYTDAIISPPDQTYIANNGDFTISDIGYVIATDILTFRVNKTTGDFFTNYPITAIVDGIVAGVTVDYTYLPLAIESIVYHGATPITLDNTFTNWVASYTSSHDGINTFNNPGNDGDAEHAFKYQADGTTLGAEGLRIKIDFETEVFDLDTSNDDTTFHTTPGSNTDPLDLSYKNYASPWKSGKLSWQRDEIYRLFVVFGNERSQLSDPRWICDLRMPSLHDTGYLNSDGSTIYSSVLADRNGGTGYITSYILRPRVYFKSFPANATFAQIYRVKRERVDRSVVTQGLSVPTALDGTTYRPTGLANVNLATEEIIKIVSPEININKNISCQSNDYIEYVSNFSGSGTGYRPTTIVPAHTYGTSYKLVENATIAFSANTRADVEDAFIVSPAPVSTDNIYCNSIKYSNYDITGTHSAKGCSGLLVAYDNASWSGENNTMALVNYKSYVYGSQYGGHTYEDRMANISIPCSNVITTSSVWHDISYGDTFINYFDATTLLADLTTANVDATYFQCAYIPLESSINCDLMHDTSSQHMITGSSVLPFLRQEYAGDHECGVLTYHQEKDLYLYNTVYSQQIDTQAAISLVVDKTLETKFDCMVKASNVKSNGEITDSWTKFGVNEFIEVDSVYGPVNALSTFNDKLFYFQDKGFGLLSVNTRSLISDTDAGQLVLGTGGVLDRYDYVTTICGSEDKFSVVSGAGGLYWYDRDNNYLMKYSNQLDKISMSKGIQSYLNNNVLTTQSVISHNDINNDEILFTFLVKVGATTTSFTIAYSENVDVFTSFYSFIPSIYIPYKNRYFTTTLSKFCGAAFNQNHIFLHDSNTYPRCYFYGLDAVTSARYVDSTIKLLYNQDYLYTKVWDNIFYMSNTYTTAGVEMYNQTLNSVRCYNDYQNTDYVTITYPTNVVRRERGWAMVIPRNLVDLSVTGNPDIFAVATLDQPTRVFRERLRDKYMIMDLKYTNGSTRDKFVLSNVGVKYRISER
jgi:hypothetical protein